jgi:AcrR family transcriptional regulator
VTSSASYPRQRRFTEDGLLDAARSLFHEQGYQETQISDIAERAGTTRATLYTRIGNKEEIYTRMLRREADVLKSWLLDGYERAANLSLHGMVDAALKPFFRFAEERRPGFDLLFGTEPGLPGSEVGQQFLNDIMGPVAGLIRSRIESVGGEAGAVSTATVAVATIGVTLHTGIYAISNNLDLDATFDVGTAYIESAFRSLDLEALARLDAASTTSAKSET